MLVGRQQQRPFRLGFPGLFLMVAALGADDHALLQKQVANLHGRLQKAARVVPQIDNQAAHAVLFQPFDGGVHFRCRRLAEMGNAEVADLICLVEHVVPVRRIIGLANVAEDAGDVDFFPRDRQLDWFGSSFVAHGQGDFLAGIALDHIDGLVETHLVGGLAVDLEDDVAGQDARLVGGCAGHGANDREPAARLRVGADVDADTAELALARLGELLVFLGIDVGGMGIEPFEAALNHVSDEPFFAILVDRRHVVLAHLMKRINHETDHFIVLVLLASGSAIENGGAEQRQ